MNFNDDFKALLAKHGIQGGVAAYVQNLTTGQVKGQIAVGLTGSAYEGHEEGSLAINLAVLHLKEALENAVNTLPSEVFTNAQTVVNNG